MHDNYLHINPVLNRDYPEPDITADEAWAAMKWMLDSNPARASKKPGRGGKPGLLLLLTAGGAALWWMYAGNKRNSGPGNNEAAAQAIATNKPDKAAGSNGIHNPAGNMPAG